MWLEQTMWIWGPLAFTGLVWMVSRLVVLSREVQTLRMRIIQIEQPGRRMVETGDRTRTAA
jgi:hypothetical protein